MRYCPAPLAMAELKKSKKKKRERKERRYPGEQTYASKVAVGVGMLGGLALGAGVYSQWMSDHARGAAPFMTIGGAVVLAGALVFGDLGTNPVRVGDGGKFELEGDKSKPFICFPGENRDWSTPEDMNFK